MGSSLPSAPRPFPPSRPSGKLTASRRVRLSETAMRLPLTVAALALLASASSAAGPDFARDVLPILSDHCFQCHGPAEKGRKADLRLDTEADALRTDNPVIVPGKSMDSEIIKRMLTTDETEVMPPPKANKPLTAKQIDTLKAWIDGGAKWGKHWAFSVPLRGGVPGQKKNPIDGFVFARLEKEGLKPSVPASKETLIRRVTLELTGLPPTPEEVEAFVKDPSPTAYEAVVDRLLKSPRYGERMVWEWLEAARYADSNGYQGDGERTMWPWRDWAVKAFNDNMPFDKFTVEQIAGDLLPSATDSQKLATAFLRNHMINGEGGRIAEENRVEYGMDMAETVGTVWLGLTFNCCRCHDHKFDPVSQKNYYGLFAFFNQTPVTGGGGDPQTKPVLDYITPEQQAALKAADARVNEVAKPVADLETKLFPREKGKPAGESDAAKDLPKGVWTALKTDPAKRAAAGLAEIEKHFAAKEKEYAAKLKALGAAVAAREATRKAVVRVMVMEDQPKPRDTFILTTGLYTKPTAKVTAHVPEALPPLPKGATANRLALAKWLTSKDHPLTARVTVNRFWQQVFGTGLVKTANDFGVQGERPKHPELLDWLAVEFVESGWDVKKLLRLMVTSETYKQSSAVSKELQERDPENRLYARGVRHRLPSWMIRDQALAASGLLVDKPGGPAVKPYQPGGVWEEATFGGKRYQPDTGDALYRRSLYTFWRRIVGPTMFFDVSPRQYCSVKPNRTNTPLHALAILNDPTYVEAARTLAETVLLPKAKSDAERLAMAFRRVLAHSPTPAEEKVLLGSLTRLRKQYADNPTAAKELLSVGDSKRHDKLDPAEHAAFTQVCLLILNLDETLSKE